MTVLSFNVWNKFTKATITSPGSIQLIKYALIGILNTLVGYGSYFILLFFMNYIIALVIAHFLGVTHSFIWNKYWTFKTNGDRFKEFIRFNAVYALVLIGNIFLLGYLVESQGIDPRIAQLIFIPVITVLSFFFHKYWSFGSQK